MINSLLENDFAVVAAAYANYRLYGGRVKLGLGRQYRCNLTLLYLT